MSIYKSRFAPVPVATQTITERVFAGLESRRDDVVLVDGPTRREMTAGELVDGIKALAGGLTERGHGAGATVALLLPNIPEFPLVYHAVAWAGGTVTTINPSYTAREVAHQLKDSGASLLVTVPMFAETAREAIEGTGVEDIAVVGEAEGCTPLAELMGEPLEAQMPVDLDEHIVVLPYSSGTTGLPKGVMLSHRNLSSNVDQFMGLRPCDEGEWTVAFLPFFHIYGMTVLMNSYLGNGGRIITMPRFDLELFLTLCQDYKTPQAWLVPPVVLALAKHPMVDQYDLSALEYVFSGAAPLGVELEEAVKARIGATCEQGYGMTEMSPISHASPRGGGRPGSVGPSAPNTECRIVDPETGKDMGVDEEGELWVRGPQIMKGYLNNEAATRETITEDGWLRTGDIAAFDADGYLRIADRLKELIKYKGFQVAPAEIESVLVSHDDVADAAVLGIQDDEAGEVPVAFLVPRDGAEISLAGVQSHLSGKLSSYKQVQAIHIVDEIPKSASGKILRRVLRQRLAG